MLGSGTVDGGPVDAKPVLAQPSFLSGDSRASHQQFSISVAVVSLTYDDEFVAKWIFIFVAMAVALAVLVIFISPLTDLLPARYSNQTPAIDLFASVLAFIWALSTGWTRFDFCSNHGTDRPVESSDRLELICTHRC